MLSPKNERIDGIYKTPQNPSKPSIDRIYKIYRIRSDSKYSMALID